MNFARDSIPTAVFQFADQFGDHLTSDAPAANRKSGSNIPKQNSILPEFVNHKADDAPLRFGDHSDRIPAPERFKEIVPRPNAVRPMPINRQHVVQVSANHPSKMKASELF